MPKEGKQSIENTLQSTLIAIQAGVQRGAMSFLEYPLECIKTRWQACPNKTLSFVIQSSYKKYGLRSFYTGMIPSVIKKLPMQAYRWPLILQLPMYYEGMVFKHEHLQGDKTTINTINYLTKLKANIYTAVTIATFEAGFGAPIETCRLQLTINQSKTKSIRQHLRETPSIKHHFTGIPALYLKGVLGWSSFLAGANISRIYWKQKNEGKSLLTSQIALTSVAIGLTNATLIIPADVIRAQQQRMYHAKTHLSFLNTVHFIYNSFGIKGFYCGWQIRVLQLTLATFLSLPVMDAYEDKLNQLRL